VSQFGTQLFSVKYDSIWLSRTEAQVFVVFEHHLLLEPKNPSGRISYGRWGSGSEEKTLFWLLFKPLVLVSPEGCSTLCLLLNCTNVPILQLGVSTDLPRLSSWFGARRRLPDWRCVPNTGFKKYSRNCLEEAIEEFEPEQREWAQFVRSGPWGVWSPVRVSHSPFDTSTSGDQVRSHNHTPSCLLDSVIRDSVHWVLVSKPLLLISEFQDRTARGHGLPPGIHWRRPVSECGSGYGCSSDHPHTGQHDHISCLALLMPDMGTQSSSCSNKPYLSKGNPLSSITSPWLSFLSLSMVSTLSAYWLPYVIEQALGLSQKSLGVAGIGQITNLVSNDVNRLERYAAQLPYIIITPVQLVVGTLVLWKCMGLSCLAGIGLLVLTAPTQGRPSYRLKADIQLFQHFTIKFGYTLHSLCRYVLHGTPTGGV